jgi:hypothetical protein
MELRLQFPPTPEHMADHAASAVAATLKVDGIELDYGVSSLTEVDRILGGFHDEGLGAEQIGETIFSFGAYIGEVIVRSAGGSWITVEPGHPMWSANSWPLVKLGQANVTNPMGKAFNRVENGAIDSIPYFYDVFTRD